MKDAINIASIAGPADAAPAPSASPAPSPAPDSLTPEERRLRDLITPDRLPRHIAVIMDGNGRWARQQGMADRIKGHEAGSESVRAAVRACGQLGIKVLTLYAFSVENWQRPREEVAALMALLERFLRQEADEIRDRNVRLTVSGRMEDLPDSTRQLLAETIESSAPRTGLTLNLALSYGGRTEIVHAARRLAEDAQAGRLAPDAITEKEFSARLYHPELGDPDLLIRTSGEMRISNFLLWQIAYTEIHVTPVLWPDFRALHLYEAILDYQRRERRFGKVEPA